MASSNVLPLFHLYGDPPDDQAFDFIHIETISSRSSANDWVIRAHRHRNLFQILLIGQGGGEMNYEAATIPFQAPCAIMVPATIAHGYRFRPNETEGFVVSFTEDATEILESAGRTALARLRALASDPVVPLAQEDFERINALCSALNEESFLAREGFRLAMRGYLALIAIEVARQAASRDRTGIDDAEGRRPDGDRAARVAGGEFPRATAARLLRRETGDDARPAQRSRQARYRRDGGPSHPPARC